MFEKYIDELKDDIVSSTCRLIEIPSVYEKSDDPHMPFGKNANSALEYTLYLADQLGFRTKNIDGYCGYIEFGDGEEMVGIIGHLDVVPAPDTDWNYPPFEGTVHNGKIYGRGAIDDKGPVISSLYAMKAVMDNCKVHKRVRLILGLNEESGWKCIDYYKKHEESPTIGFSPDADFPAIYAEKSILSSYFKMNYSNSLNQPIRIKNIDCENNAINVVPKFCSVILDIDKHRIRIDELISFIKLTIDELDSNTDISIYQIDDSSIKLTSHGISAHAAHPNTGINAVSRMITLLYYTFIHYNINIEILNLFTKFINIELDGKSLGINIADESGKLTVNVGHFGLENNELSIGLNIRIPINTTIDTIENVLVNITKKYKTITLTSTNKQESLYIPKDNYLVKTLCDIFNKATGLEAEPIAIGGATFARAFDNCVSFGANMPGHPDMCHQVDEFISIENLILSSKIYAEAIYELAK